MSDKAALIKALSGLPKFGKGICFARVGAAIKALGLETYTSNTRKVVLTGSNGKGSVARIVNAVLFQAGYKPGTFTSPHFLEFNERFVVANQEVGYPLLRREMDTVLAVTADIEAVQQERFGVFEVLFLLALSVFKRLDADMLIFEAGIGGRYDPVRLLGSDLTVLTSVDLEHSELLGTSKELIAFDKLDACQHGGTVVLGNLEASLLDKVEAYASLNQVQLRRSQDSFKITPVKGDSDTCWQVHPATGKAFLVSRSLRGEFAKYNIATALTLCEEVLANLGRQDRFDLYQQALQNLSIPGRLNLVHQIPPVLLDSAHTEESYKLLFQSLAASHDNKSLIFLVGVSKGRDAAALIAGLKLMAKFVVVSSADHRGAKPDTLFKQIQSESIPCQLQPDLSNALGAAMSRALEAKTSLVVAGGLFFAGEVNALLQGKDNKGLFLY